jgi:hypothetical protein
MIDLSAVGYGQAVALVLQAPAAAASQDAAAPLY